MEGTPPIGPGPTSRQLTLKNPQPIKESGLKDYLMLSICAFEFDSFAENFLEILQKMFHFIRLCLHESYIIYVQFCQVYAYNCFEN